MFPRDIDQQREMIYNELVKSNVLLEKLIALQTEPTNTPAIVPENNTIPKRGRPKQ